MGEGRIGYLGKLLRDREISCTELTTRYLDAIERDNGKLNAYVRVTEEAALEAAKEVDRKIAAGEGLHTLEGIPMTLKDNISTKDVETTCCSKILKGYVPIYDATVWETLKGHNAVLLGKTNMDEFAMGSSTETSCFGGSMNPHDLSHVAGGSSGGVASAVAGNLAAYGLGSDTGGSVRQPASFCGLVGLKPTYGAVSRYGLIAYASSLDQVGPIAQTVADTAAVHDAIARYDGRDATSRRSPGGTAMTLGNSIRGIRIGVAEEYFRGIRQDVRESVEGTLKVFESLGAEIVRFSMASLDHAVPVYYILACAEASSNLGRYDGIRYGYQAENYRDVADMIMKTRSEGFGKEAKRRILLGTYVLSAGYYDAYYRKAQELRRSIRGSFREAFRACDVILTPTVPVTAFPKGFTSEDPVETYMTDICTVPVNIAGLPALSVPCGYDSKGLPIGMQLIGDSFQEGLLLNVAWQYEKETAKGLRKEMDWGVSL
jgi:aspartyl-tRNA(Asn)/glutamyl-tRNA(Gln) amidotransferase subunit A